MARICLVACAAQKHSVPIRAKDLYRSGLFKKARTFAELNADRWFILSAKHGLVEPEHVLAPYDLTLNNLPRTERVRWAEQVKKAIQARTSPNDTVIFLAGERYRERLVPELRGLGYGIELPLKGLGIGEQLSWLKRRIEANSPKAPAP